MNEIKVDRQRLLNKVKSNRVEHEKKYEEAHKEWKTEVKKQLERLLKRVESGDFNTINWYKIGQDFPEPTKHLDDYDRAIRMLEMTVDEEITLDIQAFTQYVDDDWAWKQQFVATTSNYLK